METEDISRTINPSEPSPSELIWGITSSGLFLSKKSGASARESGDADASKLLVAIRLTGAHLLMAVLCNLSNASHCYYWQGVDVLCISYKRLGTSS